MKRYDYLVVGTGLYGATCAYELTKQGKKVLLIEKRDHIAGNIYTKNEDGIDLHVYGPHIFHTNSKEIWDWINQFGEFNNFRYSPLANYQGELYSLPFSMWTFNQLWGVRTPDEARKVIKSQRFNGEVTNLEEQALSLVGEDVYKKLIEGYTTKQWRKKPTELPAFIIKRLPVRFTWDNNYFNDRYQGIPVDGYTKLVERMLRDCDVILGVDYFEMKEHWDSYADKIIYTGPIDRFFDYKYGDLEYKTLNFESHKYENIDFQGIAVMNYTDVETSWTRIIEHKHFNNTGQKNTVITYETPVEYSRGIEPYYPMNDAVNTDLYLKYKKEADLLENMHFGGRLAEYKYYDMHQVIASALSDIKKCKFFH